MPYTANRLRELREERDDKQATVAETLGISRATLSNYEQGLTPSIDNAIALARYYGVSLDYLLGLSTERSASTRSLAASFLALRRLAGDAAPSDGDVTALVDAAIAYLSSGTPCGLQPVAAWRDFMRHLAACFTAAAAHNPAQVMDHANAAVVAALDVTRMPAAMLEKERGASK